MTRWTILFLTTTFFTLTITRGQANFYPLFLDRVIAQKDTTSRNFQYSIGVPASFLFTVLSDKMGKGIDIRFSVKYKKHHAVSVGPTIFNRSARFRGYLWGDDSNSSFGLLGYSLQYKFLFPLLKDMEYSRLLMGIQYNYITGTYESIPPTQYYDSYTSIIGGIEFNWSERILSTIEIGVGGVSGIPVTIKHMTFSIYYRLY